MPAPTLACPRCQASPQAPRWRSCDACEAACDPFRSDGTCPRCAALLTVHPCPACGEWSEHLAWIQDARQRRRLLQQLVGEEDPQAEPPPTGTELVTQRALVLLHEETLSLTSARRRAAEADLDAALGEDPLQAAPALAALDGLRAACTREAEAAGALGQVWQRAAGAALAAWGEELGALSGALPEPSGGAAAEETPLDKLVGFTARAGRLFDSVQDRVQGYVQDKLGPLSSLAEIDEQIEAGDYRGALQACQRILSREPQDAGALCRRGVALLELGAPGDALRSLDAALELEPASAYAHAWRANARLLGGDVEGALSDADAVLEAGALEALDEPLRTELRLSALGCRAHAYQTRGDLERAGAVAEAALEVDPDAAEAHIWLGRVRLEERRLEEATDAYSRALELQPDAAGAYWGRGWSRAEGGDLDGAERDLTRSLRLELEPKTLLSRAQLRLRRGDLGGAQRDLERAAQREPDSADVAGWRARLRWLRGEREEALRDLAGLPAQELEGLSLHALWRACLGGDAGLLGADSPGAGASGWGATLAGLVRGEVESEAALAEAEAAPAADRGERRREVHLVLGLLADGRGEEDAARVHYQAALAAAPGSSQWSVWAEARLHQRDAPPAALEEPAGVAPSAWPEPLLERLEQALRLLERGLVDGAEARAVVDRLRAEAEEGDEDDDDDGEGAA